MSQHTFQPFTDRLSRDIRNDLSESFIDVLEQNSINPAVNIAQSYFQKDLAPCYRDYIEKRLASYRRVLERRNLNNQDPLYIGLLLWDEELFFEVHEILEHAWLQESGEEKLFLQAMIRTAGVYIKVDAEQKDAASRIAQKALPVIKKNRKRLDEYTDADLLIKGLANITVPAPKLLLKK